MKTFFRNFWSLSIILMVGAFYSCTEDPAVDVDVAEPVDLTMTIANTNLVMGDNLDVTFDVTDQNSEISNENFNIELSLQSSDIENPSSLFENFPTSVTFNKGEKTQTVSIPVVKEGITSKYSVALTAFVRGYKVNNPTQTVTISDYHYTTVGIKNSSDNSVQEGTKFVLEASLPVAAEEDLTVTITPEQGQEDRYNKLPSKLVIKKGEMKVESEEVEMKSIVTNSADEKLTLKLSVDLAYHPLASDELSINKIDIHKEMGTKVMDERWLYENADIMYVSSGNEEKVKEWGQTNYQIMNEGDPHPNSGNVLPAGKWKFYRAYEFHHIAGCMTTKTSAKNGGFVSNEYPACFADQNTEAVETAGNVDNIKYAWITNEGYLRMITLKESTVSARSGSTKAYGTSAFYANKFNHNNTKNHGYLPQNIRIYPGMRIETRARVRGSKAGMLPGIWLQGNQAQGGDTPWVDWPTYGEIDVMENNTVSLPNSVEQTYHFGPLQSDEKTHYNPTTSGGVPGFSGTVDQFNIYWVEWIDNNTVAMGVNGVETLRETRDNVEGRGYKWPFTTEVNTQGLHYLLTMMFLGKDAPTEGDSEYSGLTAQKVRANDYDWSNSPVPRMEIDWVRFYIDNTYTGNTLSSNKTLFY